MTNLDSVLKSRDITLLTKARLVKAMVFPVVMYGFEGWTSREHCQRRCRSSHLEGSAPAMAPLPSQPLEAEE